MLPKPSNMICQSYDSLPFIDVETEMQELTLFQKKKKKLRLVKPKSCDLEPALSVFKIRVLKHDTLLIGTEQVTN